MKDRTTQLIVILFGILVILTLYRGRFVTYISPSVIVQSAVDWRLSAEFEVYGGGSAVGVYPYLSPLDGCKHFDSLNISLQSKKSAEQLSIVQRNEGNNSDQKSDNRRRKKVCLGDSIGFSEIFEIPDDKVDSLTAVFFWADSAGNESLAKMDFVKKTSFSLTHNETPDILILLYPILWMAFGVLILAKLTKLIKD